jgi:hypothetical protein
MMFPSSLLTVLIDAAARSLLVAAVVGMGLAALRTRNVVAQKSAWTLVLTGALLMPWAAGWVARASWLPETAAFVVSAQKWSSAPPTRNTPQMTVVAYAQIARTDESAKRGTPGQRTPTITESTPDLSHFPAPTIAVGATKTHGADAAAPRWRPLSAATTALLLYLAGCGMLLARLVYGLWAAAELWFDAVPLYLDGRMDAGALHLRASERISSPVTVGSGIVLPVDFESWDAEKLRIVLAHEASHVRQRDFYLQLCASLYTAFFWFSPLGWWLKRKLGDLSETISDRAAVEHAASHASYAQVLLEFAALPRPISMGVAMAHHGRLIPRIERLLNESSFRQRHSQAGAHASPQRCCWFRWRCSPRPQWWGSRPLSRRPHSRTLRRSPVKRSRPTKVQESPLPRNPVPFQPLRRRLLRRQPLRQRGQPHCRREHQLHRLHQRRRATTTP